MTKTLEKYHKLSYGGPDTSVQNKENEEKQEIVIEKIVCNKRKCLIVVKGLELFVVKLSDASKKLAKKFATGATVVKVEKQT